MQNQQWRLMIPFSDQGSGISKVKVLLNDHPQNLEIQKSWDRGFIYLSSPLTEGQHVLNVSVKDRSGRKTQATFTLDWPPKPSQLMSPQDLLRLEPSSPLQ